MNAKLIIVLIAINLIVIGLIYCQLVIPNFGSPIYGQMQQGFYGTNDPEDQLHVQQQLMGQGYGSMRSMRKPPLFFG